ncbi:aminotransferase class I/II-fold pyridoxal phosphate-dependent enzyme [Corynebacterium sp. H113]|uniref:aminotransferase class I/II-fold pyridoxal phosphate-dependent enzyme n=1 Tax=Corynebacterium sp. H113 TaxID=3133419 RepID=UPI0030A9CE77
MSHQPTPQSASTNRASQCRTPLTDSARTRNKEWAARGLRRQLSTFSTAQLPHAVVDKREYLLFSSSDYLGLSTHPRLVEAATEALRTYGVGSGGSRLTTGTSLHTAAEHALAQFFGADDAVLFASGYQANLSTIATIATADVQIFSDATNHASIIDGCKQAAAKVTVFPHRDYVELDRLLAQCPADNALVISDGVFSMSGALADVKELHRVCQKHGAWLMIDDAHGTGVIGKDGHGLCAAVGAIPDILVVTASKALGSEGGAVICSTEIAELLRNQARSFVYSTSLNPGSVAAIIAALDVVRTQTELVSTLQSNISYLRQSLGIASASENPTLNAPIIPLPIGDEERAMSVAAALRDEGIFVPAIRYPTVPRGQAMLRLTMTARHTTADIDRVVSVVQRASS